MKISVFIFLLVTMTASAVLSQTSKYHFGVQIQGGISNLEYQNEANSTFEKFTRDGSAARFSPGASILGVYKASPRFQVQIGLGYELSGYRVKAFEVYQTTPDMPEGVYLGVARGQIHYHDLLLALHAKVNPMHSLKAFYLLGGVTNLLNVGRKYSTTLAYESGEVEKYTQSFGKEGRKITPWNFRGDLGFGYEFNINEKRRIFVEPVFGYALLPVLKEGAGKYYQYSAAIRVGFVW
jgi:hypothetical protein